MEVAESCSNLPCDKLAVPSSCDLVGNVALLVCNIAADFIGVLASPSARLEGQYALVASAVVRDLQELSFCRVISIGVKTYHHVTVVIDGRRPKNEARTRTNDRIIGSFLQNLYQIV